MRAPQAGSTIAEVLVATLIFTTVAAGLARTLVAAQRARQTSKYWMQATQLAAEGLERWRAGDRRGDPSPVGRFTRSWQTRAAVAPALRQVDVTVTWEDGGPQHFTLSGLVRER